MKHVTRLPLAAFGIASSLAHLALAAPADSPGAAPATAPAGAPAQASSPAAVPAPSPPTSPAATPTPAAAAPTAPPSEIAPAPATSAPPTTDTGAAPPASAAPLEKAKPSSLELSLSFGPSVLWGEAANPEFDPSVTRFGAYGAFGIGYRSSYFIDPFLEVGYGSLATGEVTLPNDPAWGTGGTLEQHLGVWTISPGLTAELWRFRPRFGMGLAVVVQGYHFGGEDHSSTQLPLLAQFGLGFVAYDSPRVRLDIEARQVVIGGADVHFTTIDVLLRADAIYFGGQ